MNGFVSNLTAVALLAHVLVGCCWHHEHACCPEPAGAATADCSSADYRAHPCVQDHRCLHEPAGGDHPNRDGCEGSQCVFVNEQPGRIPIDALADSCHVATFAVALGDGLPPELNLYGRTSAAIGRCPPLPIYLLHQVLLL